MPTDDCLERQARVLAEHATVSVASGARIIINSKGRVMFTRSGSAAPASTPVGR
jgi:hypothetical protein